MYFLRLQPKAGLRNSLDPDPVSDFWPDPDSINRIPKHTLSEERQRAKTLSPMRVTGIPYSRAEMAVHLPKQKIIS